MQVIAEKTASAFLARVGAYLASAPIENNLLLGIISSVGPEQGAEPLLLCVEEQGRVELVAVQTPPRPLVLSRGGDEAIRRLVEHLASARMSLPGVNGPRQTAEAFVRVWSERVQVSGTLSGLQNLYELGTLVPPASTSGHLREARAGDEETLADWSLAFQDEVGVYVGVGNDARPFVRAKMDARQLLVWDDGRPVSMAGWAARTPDAVRVNYVYTPPAERRKGYAGACVAALSKRLLDEGSKTCILFADAANSTSNGVYVRLGYERVCEFSHYEFVPH
jgi:uncharacterized protein